MPAENALKISEAFHIICMIFMGKMGYEPIEANEDRVIMHVNDCGSINLHKETDIPITFLQNLCPFYSARAVESLNPKYTMNFSKKICAGDECCEYAIELKK